MPSAQKIAVARQQLEGSRQRRGGARFVGRRVRPEPDPDHAAEHLALQRNLSLAITEDAMVCPTCGAPALGLVATTTAAGATKDVFMIGCEPCRLFSIGLSAARANERWNASDYNQTED